MSLVGAMRKRGAFRGGHSAFRNRMRILHADGGDERHAAIASTKSTAKPAAAAATVRPAATHATHAAVNAAPAHFGGSHEFLSEAGEPLAHPLAGCLERDEVDPCGSAR